jgi:hypothetical protein
MSTIVDATTSFDAGACVGSGCGVGATVGELSSSEEQATRTIVMAPISKSAPYFFIFMIIFRSEIVFYLPVAKQIALREWRRLVRLNG